MIFKLFFFTPRWVLALRVRVNLGVMTMNRIHHTPKAPEFEPHHPM